MQCPVTKVFCFLKIAILSTRYWKPLSDASGLANRHHCMSKQWHIVEPNAPGICAKHSSTEGVRSDKGENAEAD